MRVGAAKQRRCLAQVPVAAQRSEAVALPQGLELVDAADRVGSLAARGTRPALVACLRARETSYVRTLPQNQRAFGAQVPVHFAPLLAPAPAQEPRAKGHGRGQTRRGQQGHATQATRSYGAPQKVGGTFLFQSVPAYLA